MAKDFSVTVNGEPVAVVIGDYSGLYIPKGADPHIIIMPTDDELGRDYMDSLCHEMAHHILGLHKIDSENRAHDLARGISTLLWARGYRLKRKSRRRRRRR